MNKENLVSMYKPFAKEEINRLNALREVDKHFNFCYLVYGQRELLSGTADTSKIDYFLEHVNINLADVKSDGENLIFFTISSHAPAMLKYMLDKGLSLDTVSKSGLTPLQYAEEHLRQTLSLGWKAEGHMVACIEECILIIKGHKQ